MKNCIFELFAEVLTEFEVHDQHVSFADRDARVQAYDRNLKGLSYFVFVNQ